MRFHRVKSLLKANEYAADSSEGQEIYGLSQAVKATSYIKWSFHVTTAHFGVKGINQAVAVTQKEGFI